MERETIIQALDSRYPIIIQVQLSELFEVAEVADPPQPVPLQIDHLQFWQHLKTLDLPQLVTAYIPILLLS